MYYPDLETVKKLKQRGKIVPVYREVVADMETPVSAFLKIHRGGYAFLLESVEGGERLGRYSFLGVNPSRVLRTLRKDKNDPLAHLATALKKNQSLKIEGLPKFCGGAVGYLGYETVTCFEDLPVPGSDPLNLPDALFMLVDTLLVFDHVAHKIKVVSHARLDGDINTSYKMAVKRIEELIARLNQPLPVKVKRHAPANRNTAEFASNFRREDYLSRVQKIKEYITQGEAIQVVLSQRLSKETDAPPFEIYRALRGINPSPYMFYLDCKDFQIIGASPEILVRVENDVVTTRPLAGTRPRGVNSSEDSLLEQELKNDEKERAEHIMLVALGRNDIGRVSLPGSVVVSDLMNVERYSHVMHLVTNVQGQLAPGENAFSALRACFPAGTVSGAPKVRAMEIIAEMETEVRGPYAGAVGYFSSSGDMDMAIAIRTMVMKQKTVYVQAGGGIVYDSVPEKEWEETINKAKAQLKAVAQAEKSLQEAG